MNPITKKHDGCWRIAVIDSEESFLENLRNSLVLNGYRHVYATSCKLGATDSTNDKTKDIIFIEINDTYADCWNSLTGNNHAFIIATTNKRCSLSWESATKKGAHMVLLKQQMSALLLTIMSDLTTARALKPSNVIQFPICPKYVPTHRVGGSPPPTGTNLSITSANAQQLRARVLANDIATLIAKHGGKLSNSDLHTAFGSLRLADLEAAVAILYVLYGRSIKWVWGGSGFIQIDV